MPLTPQNMETVNGVLNPSKMFRDIARMDEGQLKTYMVKAFTGDRDLSLLPEPFWDYWFDNENFGNSSDGKVAPGPGAFLASLHDIVGSISRGSFSIAGPAPDFEFRPRFRKILAETIKQGIQVSFPTEQEKAVIRHTIDALNNIQDPTTFRDEGEMINTQKARELDPRKLEYPDYLESDLRSMQDEMVEMVSDAKEILIAGKFGEIEVLEL